MAGVELHVTLVFLLSESSGLLSFIRRLVRHFRTSAKDAVNMIPDHGL